MGITITYGLTQITTRTSLILTMVVRIFHLIVAKAGVLRRISLLRNSTVLLLIIVCPIMSMVVNKIIQLWPLQVEPEMQVLVGKTGTRRQEVKVPFWHLILIIQQWCTEVLTKVTSVDGLLHPRSKNLLNNIRS
jgi:hypothetical protein